MKEKKKASGSWLPPVIWAVLLALGLGLRALGLGQAGAVMDKILRILTLVGGVLLATWLLRQLLLLLKPGSHRTKTLFTVFASVIRYVAAIVLLCWGLSILGVDLSTIVTSVGILALIIGFGAESLIEDLVTGTFMLLENQYNVGDIVEVGGFRGTVHEIGIRTTSLMDVGGNIKIINNSDMRNILNRSDNVSVAGTSIDVPYETDLEDFEPKIPGLMQQIFEKHRDVMLSPPRYLGVQELGASGVTLKFVVEVEEDKIFSAPRILNRELLVGFRKLGVECPFPQVDVHQR